MIFKLNIKTEDFHNEKQKEKVSIKFVITLHCLKAQSKSLIILIQVMHWRLCQSLPIVKATHHLIMKLKIL